MTTMCVYQSQQRQSPYSFVSGSIITVENLSKCHLVGHQSARGERYVALREVIASGARLPTCHAADKSYKATTLKNFGLCAM
jgi:hypothetical protein